MGCIPQPHLCPSWLRFIQMLLLSRLCRQTQRPVVTYPPVHSTCAQGRREDPYSQHPTFLLSAPGRQWLSPSWWIQAESSLGERSTPWSKLDSPMQVPKTAKVFAKGRALGKKGLGKSTPGHGQSVTSPGTSWRGRQGHLGPVQSRWSRFNQPIGSSVFSFFKNVSCKMSGKMLHELQPHSSHRSGAT